MQVTTRYATAAELRNSVINSVPLNGALPAYEVRDTHRGREVIVTTNSVRPLRLAVTIDHWGVQPSIYREVPDGPERRGKLQGLAATACQLGHAIAQKLDLAFDDAMAIAQHNSTPDVLGVRTWLADFSRDPWVGLFFATDGGTTGDYGIVWSIMPTKYAASAAGDGNRSALCRSPEREGRSFKRLS